MKPLNTTHARKNARQELQRLRDANLPRMSWRDILTLKDGEVLPEADVKALSEYFSQFVFEKDGRCICCGEKQGGNLVEAAVGIAKFTWGLAHGEGICSECGWPARAYHRNVGPIKFFQAILQYHPDELEKNEP